MIKGSIIKNIAIGILLGIIGIISFELYLYNKTITNTNHLNNSLEISNTNLKRKLDSLQIIYLDKEKRYYALDSVIEYKNKQLNILRLENFNLQSKLTNLENEMVNVSSDSSYNYLMHRYIPTQDSLKYGFAPNQVKNIHFDLLSFDETEKLNINMSSTIDVLFDMYLNSSFKFETCDQQKSILIEKNSLLESNIDNLTNNITLYTKQIKKQKFKLTMFGIGTAGLATYIIIKSVTNK